MTADSTTLFNEILVLMDDQSWIWNLVKQNLDKSKLPYVRLPSNVPIRQSWDRFKNSNRIIIHWECEDRSGGALIEEILDVAPDFNTGDRIIVLFSNPTHEDMVYFNELGLKRIIPLRNRDKELKMAGDLLVHHLSAPPGKTDIENGWQQILHALDTLVEPVDPQDLMRLETSINRIESTMGNPNARTLDALALIAMYRENYDQAEHYWKTALDKNPTYYRTYNNLIRLYRKTNKLKEAFVLMKKMQELNKSNISRLVAMGEVHAEMADEQRAEHYFKLALEHDNYCSGALNGLAEIRFYQGDLEESRQLLSKSQMAYKTAARLNRKGIEMVQQKKYKDALEHYTRAQFVLPQQEKGPMLFYNIGLCYFRWGQPEMAKDFLNLALIKCPDYEKAKKLLDSIQKSANKPQISA